MKYIAFITMLMLVLSGCKPIESTNRVQYEDKTSVVDARVLQWNDDVEIKALTDVNGTWTIQTTIGTEWSLCIENPKESNALCCYDGLLTIREDGELVDYAE